MESTQKVNILASSNEHSNHVAAKAIDFHCHGIGKFDFTEINNLDLQEIEDILAARNQRTILTLYLLKPHFESFLNLMNKFNNGKCEGRFSHLCGFALGRTHH